MLKSKDVTATIAVKDLNAARKFYEGLLGLEPIGTENENVVTYRAGATHVMVYRSDEAGTNRATVATWVVGDEVDALVATLKSKGVAFENYDFPGIKHEGDVHVMGEMRNAWFKDPDGNILSLVSGSPVASSTDAR